MQLLALIAQQAQLNVGTAQLPIMIFAVWILWKMQISMDQLNTKIAVVIEKVESHEKRLDRLEER